MALMLEYSRHAVVDGEAGAWFKGRAYKENTKFRKFLSYAFIEKTLKSDAGRAKQPFGHWAAGRMFAGKQSVECEGLTSEFKKALAHGVETISKLLHSEASKGVHRCFVFSGFEFFEELGEHVALFRNHEEQRRITLGEIKGYLAGDLKNQDPRTINFYLADGQDSRGPNLPGAELVRAYVALCNIGLPESERIEMKPAHVSPHSVLNP